MKAKDDHVMLLDEGLLFAIDGIVREEARIVAMIVESGFMRDDEIVATAGGLAQNIHCVEKCGGDAGNGRRQIAGLHGVYGVGRPPSGVVPLNAVECLCCGDGLRHCRER